MDEIEDFINQEQLKRYNTKYLLPNGNNISFDEIFNKMMSLYEYSSSEIYEYQIVDYWAEDIGYYFLHKNNIIILKKILKKMQKIQLEELVIELFKPTRVLNRITLYGMDYYDY